MENEQARAEQLAQMMRGEQEKQYAYGQIHRDAYLLLVQALSPAVHPGMECIDPLFHPETSLNTPTS